MKERKSNIKNGEIKLPKKLIKEIDNNIEAKKTILMALEIIKNVKVKYEF